MGRNKQGEYGTNTSTRIWKGQDSKPASLVNGKSIFIVYTVYTILTGPNKGEINKLVKKIGNIFKIEDQGGLSDYLGMKIVPANSTVTLTSHAEDIE
jgi:hypothetical protein